MYNKGIKVLVRTTNGGELIASLLETYRPTYDAVLAIHGSYTIIAAHRLKSIEAA